MNFKFFLERLFAACGSYVYTIWITHKPIPSMLALCQMKIKEHLLNNSLQNIDRFFLPNNLKHSLQNLYRSTIKGFLPDQKSLRSFVCNPLKSHIRLQCTMKRIDNETENSSTIPTTNTSLSGATYVLYLEYLGGLIPLLTAKRISKICPDFIIFDPQVKTSHLLALKNHSQEKNFSTLKSRSSTFHNMSSVQKQATLLNSTNRSSLITNRNSIYVADNTANNNGDDIKTTKSSSGCSSENNSEAEETDQQYDGCVNNIQDKSSKKTPTTAQTNLVKHKHVR